MRVLERSGIDALTTNGVAAEAGVSIGTLYQFFPNKEAILDRLVSREMTGTGERVMKVMQDKAIATTEDRIAAIVGAVAASYSGRHGAHRQVMAHSLARGGNRLAPLLSRLTAHLVQERQVGPIRHALNESDAFVLTHAFAGALRAMITDPEAPSEQDVADSLTRLIVRFLS